ncbi:MAG: serine/threonine protein kinase, partial [Deltaproteobacteria bacterium]|nr:serine/threonine protein kinase [Deltaproteobacteria bacterium]
LQFDEPVAVKFLLPEFAANPEALVRFEREARAAFKIKSEHVTRVLDVGRVADGAPFMVMEFLEGIDLGDLVAERLSLPVAEAVDYVLQACEAVAEAHLLGIVHRDLKPENLFIITRRDGSACVKVLDFGLSKELPLKTGQRQRALTSNEQVMGTAQYMSPEQWVSAKDTGPETDIWAIGVILYEVVSGYSPFLRDKLARVCGAVLNAEPPPLDKVMSDPPAGLDEVLRKCMVKDVRHRYHCIEELTDAVAPFASATGKELAGRIARAAARSGRAPLPFDETLASATASDLAPPAVLAAAQAAAEPAAPLPRLGIRDPDGTIERWSDIMEKAPTMAPRRSLVWVVVLLVVALAAAAIGWFALG